MMGIDKAASLTTPTARAGRKEENEMTKEQFQTAIRLHERLEALGEVKKEIEETEKHRLWYAKRYDPMTGTTQWDTVSECTMRSISDILDRHDKMIREEIEEEIAEIKRQIEEL